MLGFILCILWRCTVPFCTFHENAQFHSLYYAKIHSKNLLKNIPQSAYFARSAYAANKRVELRITVEYLNKSTLSSKQIRVLIRRPGGFFWCKQKQTKTRNASLPFNTFLLFVNLIKLRVFFFFFGGCFATVTR
jgi:hypothetical protein